MNHDSDSDALPRRASAPLPFLTPSLPPRPGVSSLRSETSRRSHPRPAPCRNTRPARTGTTGNTRGRNTAHEDSGDQLAAFLRYLDILDSRPTSSLAKQLIADGIPLPPADGLSDTGVRNQLWRVIKGLERGSTYLCHTNHLSDRELYEHLWRCTLNDPEYNLEGAEIDHTTHIDLIGDGSPASEQIYLQYYADEMDRTLWLEEEPDTILPAILPPPYDRDQFLPRPDLGLAS